MAAAGNPSRMDLLKFHRLERDFYYKLVDQLDQDPDRTKWILALWLWFESVGHHDFIRHVSAYEDDVVLRFLAEGNACLRRLIRHVDPTWGDELPLTTTLVTEPMDLRFFDYHRNVAISGVAHFYQNVANVIFDDVVVDHAADARQNRPFGEGTSSQPNGGGGGGVQSMLNPSARPWSPETNQSPEDQRSMFITFSRGYPLTREEIVEFFTSRYGNCVEIVMIERAPPGSPPMYGRVVLNSASMIAVVLNGQQTAKFMIKGRHLWARMYVPRRNN